MELFGGSILLQDTLFAGIDHWQEYVKTGSQVQLVHQFVQVVQFTYKNG